jgi:hypothetical protein
LETANREHGRAAKGVRVKEPGPYGHSQKHTILLAIVANDQGQRWRDISIAPGTTVDMFFNFVLGIVEEIGPGTPENRRCFTMDNLQAHKHPLLRQLIYAHGHLCVYRAPYYPIDGAIEYFFNTLQQYLTLMLYRINTSEDLIYFTSTFIDSRVNFVPYFIHVGFVNN